MLLPLWNITFPKREKKETEREKKGYLSMSVGNPQAAAANCSKTSKRMQYSTVWQTAIFLEWNLLFQVVVASPVHSCTTLECFLEWKKKFKVIFPGKTEQSGSPVYKGTEVMQNCAARLFSFTSFLKYLQTTNFTSILSLTLARLW